MKSAREKIMTILDKIIARKKEEIAFSKSKISINELKNSEFFGRETFSLKESVKARNGIIAEFKRQSPSKGIINDKFSPLEVVTKYEEFGASGISILTDKDFFGGSFEDILSVRNSVTIDWDKKESVQAKMRVMIKRILKKYGYPPEKQDQAVKTILEQAKMIGDEFSNNT